MAEEAKAEEKGQETLDIGTMVEEALEAKPEAEATEDDGSQADEGRKDSKGDGWLTMLPKELRDGVDASKYSSLGEYIKDLRDHQQTDVPVATNEEVESEWETLISDTNGEGATEDEKAINREVLEGLKKDGVNAKDARKTLTAYAEAIKKASEKKAEADDKALRDYIGKAWGDDSKAKFEDAKRGLQTIALENREILKMAKEAGITNNPAFIEACRMLGSRSKESVVTPTAGGSSQKNKVDPMNPFGF